MFCPGGASLSTPYRHNSVSANKVQESGRRVTPSRFHATPDHRLFVVYPIVDTGRDGRRMMENRIVEVLPDGSYSINTQKVDDSQLAGRLKEIYDPRPEKIIFIKGDPAAKYQAVIHAMDVARGAGVKVIGIPPKDIPGGAVTPAGGQ